jgi:hypothetical protein
MSGPVAAIDALTREFFGAFTNKGGVRPDVARLHRLFLPQAVITKRDGNAVEIYDLERFIAPRLKLLTDGSLVEFEEQEESARTEVFGGIAQRWCTYRKAGKLHGRPYAGRGVKTIQFVRLDGAWRISALAWEDEPAAPTAAPPSAHS